MVLKPILAGILMLVSSTFSFAASSLIANQYVAPSRLIGGALPQTNLETFTVQTGYPVTYSKSLNYSTGPIIDTSGNPVAQGNASTSISFDLSRGEFKQSSESLLPSLGPTVGSLGAGSSVSLYDYLTVHSPTASSTNPTFLTLHLETEGSVSLSNPLQLLTSSATIKTELTARNETDRSLSSGHTVSACSFFAGSDCSSTGGVGFNGGGFATTNAQLTDGGKDEVTLRVPLYHETSVVQFDMRLDALTIQGSADLSHTARLFINVPGGSFTSESGIVSAIPEPEAYSMLLVGLALVGFMSRRKSLIV